MQQNNEVNTIKKAWIIDITRCAAGTVLLWMWSVVCTGQVYAKYTGLYKPKMLYTLEGKPPSVFVLSSGGGRFLYINSILYKIVGGDRGFEGSPLRK